MATPVIGKVEKIFVKAKESTDQYGNNFTRSMQVNGTWYSFGGMKTENWNVKVGADFKVLGVGSEVMFMAESNEGRDGKTYWNGKALTVTNIVEGDKKGAGASKPQGGTSASTSGQTSHTGASGGSYKPKDMTGVAVGHSFNGAMNFIQTFGLEASNDNLVRYATSVHNVTEKLKKEIALAFPDKSEYDVGAGVGNSVLNAAKLVGTDSDFESTLEGIARDLYLNVIPVIEKYVREGRGAAAAPKVSRAAPKKTGVTKAKPAPEPVADDPEVSEDQDSDIPF